MKSFLLVTIILLSFVLNTNAQIIDGYTDKQSYKANETITFYLNGVPTTTLDANGNFVNDDFLTLFDISGNFVLSISGFSNMVSQGPSTNFPWQDGFGYAATATWVVPTTLKSGYYLLDGKIPVIIKGDASTADMIIVVPTNTNQAYNTTQGYDFYLPTNSQATVVSFLRPINLSSNSSYGYYIGFLKWFISTTYANLNISYIADIDMDDYSEITHAKLLMLVGHTEYWTRLARLNFDQFVDNGKDAIVLGGNNMYWQVRYDNSNTQLVCYKTFTDPSTNDDLLKTWLWCDVPLSLKYSTISSIGADWDHGGYGNFKGCYGGFDGFKIINDQSPILNGTTGLSNGNILQFYTGEYDHTLISNADPTDGHIIGNNGVPLLDKAALGFYRAELIAYDQTNHDDAVSNPDVGKMQYAPLMAFQKTCNSGKIINAASNHWCSDNAIGGITASTEADNPYIGCISNSLQPDFANIRQITANMIDLLFNNQNIWANPNPPTVFELKPNSKTVSYTACADGVIHITPCGIEVINGYKVDRNDGVLSLGIDNNCATYTALKTTNTSATHTNPPRTFTANKKPLVSINKPITNTVTLSPNPTTGSFTLELFSPISEPAEAAIYNTLGVKVQTITTFNQLTQGINRQQINTEQLAPGFYNIQLKTATQVVNKQFIIQ